MTRRLAVVIAVVATFVLTVLLPAAVAVDDDRGSAAPVAAMTAAPVAGTAAISGTSAASPSTSVGPSSAATPAAEPGTGGPESPTRRWLVQPAGARGDASTRSYFVYDLAPGNSVEDTVAIVNLSDEPLTLALLGSDAYTDLANGGFGLRPSADRPTDTGAWVRLATDSVTIPAKARVEVPFLIQVPANATPGDHAGGIVTSFVAPAEGADGQSVVFDARIAVRIYLRVDGDLAPGLSVSDVSTSLDMPVAGTTGTLTVDYTVANTGNVRLGADETVRVAAPFGVELKKSTSGIQEILPDGSVKRQAVFTGVAPTLWLHVDVDVTPVDVGGALAGTGLAALHASDVTAAVPWLWLVVVLVVLAAAVLLVRRRRRRWKALRAEVHRSRKRDAGVSPSAG